MYYIGNFSREEEQGVFRQANISIFLTNLRAYDEGDVIGEWVRLPCSAEDMQQVFERNYITTDSGWFISDYELKDSLSNMKSGISMYTDVDEINYVAAVLDELPDDDYKKFECIVSSGIKSFSSVIDYVTLVRNLDCYDVLPAKDEEEIGRCLMKDKRLPDINGIPLSEYIDYKAIGRQFMVSAHGAIGFCICNQLFPDEKVEVPAEYRIIPTEREAGNEIIASEEKEDYEFER